MEHVAINVENLYVMRMQRNRQEIVTQNQEILTNISQMEKTAHQNELRAKGHILFTEARSAGFKKVGWDVYQRPEDVDAGQIWSVENIDGDKWLVCYTDTNDYILRNVTQAAIKYRMSKSAGTIEGHDITIPLVGYGLQPGDLVEITPRQSQSINYKYAGYRGIVVAAMPDRSELKFEDGSSLWVENKDLTPIVDAKEMQIGNEVRMFSKDISGRITKISHDGKYITFRHKITGQEFHTRKGDVVKTALFIMQTDPFSPEDTKAGEKALKTIYAPPIAQQPSGEMERTPTKEIPPSIKQSPSPMETELGTSMPASEFVPSPMGGDMGGNMGGGIGAPIADTDKVTKTGRRMFLGDSVQKKSTGEKGTIVDIQFDKKLGKFYLIDFGAEQPEQIYDTDLMKLKENAPEEAGPMMPTDVTPGPTRFIGGKRAVLDSRYDTIKSAAFDFVSGMVSQALANHEVEFPGTKPQPQLEEVLTKQAIITYISKYMPPDLIQSMATEDKNELSEWLQFEITGKTEDTPTAQEFIPDKDTTIPVQQTPEELAITQVNSHIASHIEYESYLPSKFASPIDRNRFIHQAISVLEDSGIAHKTSHFIAQSIVSQGNCDSPFIRHTLQSQFKYEPKILDQLFDVVSYKLATCIFTTPRGLKYALDLPGMETLRGGGGGYPGSIDADPMGWEVKNPQTDEMDPAILEKALEEQLMDQSKPFEEKAPKLTIELDSENKQIIIDYNQEEDAPIMPIEGAPGGLLPGKESPNMPSPSGPAGPKPGDTRGPGANSSGDFSNQDIPVNF